MHAANFTLSRYLERIGHAGDLRADSATLAALMRRQLFSVPFENLDVQAGRVVSLAPEDIVDKILARGRGGYCYEVNGLFAMALQALGIPYRFVAARPMFYPVRRPKTHMALVARVEGADWLCDLGFGSYGIRAPLNLADLDREVRQDMDAFRLSRAEGGEYLLQARAAGQWQNQYGFDLSPQEWIDFAPANYLNSTHPDAIFVQKRVVVLHAESGRSILVGNTLKVVAADAVTETLLDDAAAVAALRQRFGLDPRAEERAAERRAASIEHARQHVGDHAAGDGDQDQVVARHAPFVAGMHRQPGQHRARHHLLGDAGGQRLAARQVLADARRQGAIAGGAGLHRVAAGGRDADAGGGQGDVDAGVVVPALVFAVALPGMVRFSPVLRRRRPGGLDNGGTGRDGHESGEMTAHDAIPELRCGQRIVSLERALSPLASGFSHCNNRNLAAR
jgi:N-hydroxyarylamine O-acetyltransferase